MFESNRELLSLCYDSVVEIRDGYYIVGLDGKYGVADAGNKIAIKIENHNIEIIDELLFVEKRQGCGVYAYSANSFEPSNTKPFNSLKRFTEDAWIVSNDESNLGILNSKGQLMLPEIYSHIWKCGSNSQYDFLKLRLSAVKLFRCGRQNPTNDKMSYIRVNKSYTEFDGYFAIETDNEQVQIVATSIENNNKYNIDCKYRLRLDGSLVGPEFDSMLMRNGLKQLGLIQTYNDINRVETYTGIMKFNGEELVPCDRYNDVQYIGNGIAIVSKEKKHGTFVKGSEVVPVGTLDRISILNTIPLSVGFIKEKLYYIGNDGNIYEKIEEAFPIYKSKLDNNINLLCMYGTWIYVTNELKMIRSVPLDIQDKHQWIKL